MLYLHNVHYYETDKMGVTHHSNYIRWMEEARVSFLKEIGWPYEKIEENGIISPVTNIECDYKIPTKFSDVISIEITVKEYSGVKLELEYIMKNQEDKTVCISRSKHCFLDTNNKIISLKKSYPEFNEALINAFEKEL